MLFALGVTYWLFAILSAHVVTRMLDDTFGTDELCRIRRSTIWLAVFCCAFFLPFHLIGTLELLWRQPSLSVTSLLVAQSALAGITLAFGRRIIRATHSNAVAVSALSPSGSGRFDWRSPSESLAVVGILLFALVAVFLLMSFPRGYEVRAYHLPIAVHMFQSGTLRTWDHASMHTFPANMSAYAGFLLQTLPERLVSIANLPFLGLASFVVYGLGRLIGGDTKSSLLATVGLTTIPIFAFSSFQIGADVAGSALIGLAFLVALAAPNGRRSWILIAGLCAGLAFGFKSLHLIGSVFLGFVILIRGWGEDLGTERHERLGRAFRNGLVFSCGFGLTAGFWLLRNAVELGNPIYPVHLGAVFNMLGWTQAPDVNYLERSMTQSRWVRTSAEWLVYPWVEWHYRNSNFKHNSGLGAFFAAFIPVAWGAGLAAIALGRQRMTAERASDRKAFNFAVLVIGSLFIAVTWWILDDRQPRYVMGSIMLGVPLVAPMLTGMQQSHRRILEMLAVLCISVMFFVVASKQGVEFGADFVVKKRFSRSDFYKYPAVVDALPAGSKVLNLGNRTYNYAMFGNRLTNRVVSPNHARMVLLAAGKDRLTTAELDSLGVSHIHFVRDKILDSPGVRLDPCVKLKEVGRRGPDQRIYLVERAASQCRDE